jgi:hypothetical protein
MYLFWWNNDPGPGLFLILNKQALEYAMETNPTNHLKMGEAL